MQPVGMINAAGYYLDIMDASYFTNVKEPPRFSVVITGVEEALV